ncbi:putative phage tail tape measure protein [Acaryochloris phage A-HIS1]|nr:putative phage tail tape measure protein [Acaryochloris phage A-HIS1]
MNHMIIVSAFLEFVKEDMAETIYKIITKLEGSQSANVDLNKLAVAAGATGAALGVMSKAALDAANDLDTSFNALGTLLEDPEREIKEFDAALSELSDELKNTVSINKLAAESYDVVSAGFTDAADAAEVLKASQKLALVGQGDLKNAADGLTTTLNAMSGTLGENATVQEKSTRVASVFAETIRLGKTNIDALGPAIAQVAPLANNLDISIETLGASFATLTANGTKTAQSATQLRALFQALTVQSEQSKKVSAELGLTFNEQSIRADGLSQTLKNIANATNGNTDALARLLGSSEAVNGFITLSKNNFESLDAAITATGDSAVQSGEKLNGAYDRLADSRVVRAEAALNKLNDTMIKIGQGVAIAIEPAINALSFLIDTFDALPEPLQVAVGVIAALTAGALSLGAALVAVSVAINQVTAAGLLTFLKTAVASMLTATVTAKGVAASMLALKVAILPVIASVAALTVGILAVNKAWSNYNDLVKTTAKRSEQLKTESLVNDLEKLNDRLNKTGKAIPDKEFDIYVKEAKAAANETNQLGKFVEVLERKQAAAKKGIDDTTKANIANAESELQKAQALQNVTVETERASAAIREKTEAELRALEVQIANGQAAANDTVANITNTATVTNNAEAPIANGDSIATQIETLNTLTEGIKGSTENIAQNVFTSIENQGRIVVATEGILNESRNQTAKLSDLQSGLQDLRNIVVQGNNNTVRAINRLPRAIAASIPRPSNID